MNRLFRSPLSPPLFNDPYFAHQWPWQTHLDSIDLGLVSVYKKWGFGRHPIRVAIIDSGITSSPELSILNSLNLLDPTQPEAPDSNGHGTHIAHLIGAKPNNRYGLVGLAGPQVQLFNIKKLDSQLDGLLDDGALAIDQAIAWKADIINCSWGGYVPSQALHQAIIRAGQAGILIVAGAGNDRLSMQQHRFYPAAYADYDHVISVTAIDSKGKLEANANWGSNVTVAAPGVNLGSLGLDLQWEIRSGTSMATALVTGALAFYKSHFPNRSASQIKQLLVNSSQPIRHLNGKTQKSSYLHLFNMMSNKSGLPDRDDPKYGQRKNYFLATPHPYPDHYLQEGRVEVPGAKRVALYFSAFKTENSNDKLELRTAKGDLIQTLSGVYEEPFFSEYIPGSVILYKFTSDHSIHHYGFEAQRLAYQ